jgi:hypothetical protein
MNVYTSELTARAILAIWFPSKSRCLSAAAASSVAACAASWVAVASRAGTVDNLCCKQPASVAWTISTMSSTAPCPVSSSPGSSEAAKCFGAPASAQSLVWRSILGLAPMGVLERDVGGPGFKGTHRQAFSSAMRYLCDMESVDAYKPLCEMYKYVCQCRCTPKVHHSAES